MEKNYKQVVNYKAYEYEIAKMSVDQKWFLLKTFGVTILEPVENKIKQNPNHGLERKTE